MNTLILLLLAAPAAWQQMPAGDALRLRGDYPAAEREYLRLAADPATPPESLGAALSGLAMVYLETHRLVEAEAMARRVVALESIRCGPRSAEAGYALDLLGSALSRLKRHREAEQALREGVTICAAVLGPGHLQTSRVRANLAAAMIARGRLSAAEPVLRTAEAALRAELGDGHMEVAVLRHNLGTLYLQQRRLPLAESEFTAALRTWERLFGVRSPYFVRTANLLVRTRYAARETASAKRLLDRILPLAEDLFGPSHPETARARFSRAALEMERGDPASAEKWARDAIETQKDRLPDDREEFLEELSFYRNVLMRLGQRAGARRVERWSRHIRGVPATAGLSAYLRQPCPSSL